jgi:hypothetical protein
VCRKLAAKRRWKRIKAQKKPPGNHPRRPIMQVQEEVNRRKHYQN